MVIDSQVEPEPRLLKPSREAGKTQSETVTRLLWFWMFIQRLFS